MDGTDSYDLPYSQDELVSANKSSKLSKEGQLLASVLSYAEESTKKRAKAFKGKPYRVSGIGGAISNTYEKIRNSTEYTDEHLLLQRAIRRYLSRDLFLGGKGDKAQLVEEMVTELTQAGYIPNDSVSAVQLEDLNKLITASYDLYAKIKRLNVAAATAQTWLLDTLSVECEWVFHNPYYLFAYAHFCYEHTISANRLGGSDKSTEEQKKLKDTYMLYYLAVLKNLLKADRATMRTVLMAVYRVPNTAGDFKKFNTHFDELLLSKQMKNTNIIVNHHSAPLRILRSCFFEENKQNSSILNNKQSLMSLVRKTTEASYVKAEQKLNNGIVKSIVFLVITKFLIGLAIEIPVDFLLYDAIIWLPLAINLLAPPLFLLFQRFTIRIPGERNTVAIQEYIAEMLYDDSQAKKLTLSKAKISKAKQLRGFGVAYTISTLLIFSLVIYVLAVTGFNFLQGIIFFVFMSTATFLGFRLSLIVKDIELVRADQTFSSAVRDFIYTPFIILGQWLSGKYAQVNIISTILDLVIELPLKSVLRLTRQWVRFLDEKKETLV